MFWGFDGLVDEGVRGVEIVCISWVLGSNVRMAEAKKGDSKWTGS